MHRDAGRQIVYLSRVTWLVFGTALVLVSAVLVAAVVFINGGGQTFPSGGQAQSGGVVRVHSAQAGADREAEMAAPGPASRPPPADPRWRPIPRRPASPPLSAARTPARVAPRPGTPPGDQYGGRLQQLKAALAP